MGIFLSLHPCWSVQSWHRRNGKLMSVCLKEDQPFFCGFMLLKYNKLKMTPGKSLRVQSYSRAEKSTCPRKDCTAPGGVAAASHYLDKSYPPHLRGYQPSARYLHFNYCCSSVTWPQLIWLVFCNVLYMWLPLKTLQKLQLIQNVASRQQSETI